MVRQMNLANEEKKIAMTKEKVLMRRPKNIEYACVWCFLVSYIEIVFHYRVVNGFRVATEFDVDVRMTYGIE